MTRLAKTLAGPWTDADQRRLDDFLKETETMPAPASHTRKSAYNATMSAVDELARVQIHAMASGSPSNCPTLRRDSCVWPSRPLASWRASWSGLGT